NGPSTPGVPGLGRRPGQDLALASVVGPPDHALLLHPFDQRSSAVVADLQPALDVAGGRLSVPGDDGHGLVVEVVAAAAFAAHAKFAVLFFIAACGDLVEILWRALVAQEGGH